ncbi:hypothetical protein HOE31_00300 [bacterium]|jgi:hypothetical protein|nr:hypothetical protein [bacterium]MBT4121382.1 hypothetical protein [bacterium]MBT4335059.1 hypothetical protein [bacterium]MBT4495605.1 hypothetical protein [bacterium]MBT4764085.1 hypothetical protein [bacterium]
MSKYPKEIKMSKKNEYRDGATIVAKESAWTFWRFLPLLLLVIVVVLLVVWSLKSTGIIGKDIEREVVQHSQQYVESKQAKLQNLYTKYVELQTKATEAEFAGVTELVDVYYAQQKAILVQMRREVTNIPSHQVPPEVQKLLQ